MLQEEIIIAMIRLRFANVQQQNIYLIQIEMFYYNLFQLLAKIILLKRRYAFALM